MADRPRTFAKVVDVKNPEELTPVNRGDKYQDPAVNDPASAKWLSLKIATAAVIGLLNISTTTAAAM